MKSRLLLIALLASFSASSQVYIRAGRSTQNPVLYNYYEGNIRAGRSTQNPVLYNISGPLPNGVLMFIILFL